MGRPELAVTLPTFASRYGISLETYPVNRLKQTYRELSLQAGRPSRLFYPSGRSDVSPLLMPSVSVMATADKSTFLLPTHGKPISQHVYSTLSRHKSKFVSLESILRDSQFTPEMSELFARNLDESISISSFSTFDGYYTDLSKPGTKPVNDIFMDVLGSLVTIGVDLSSVKIGMFNEDYRVLFSLDGRQKTLIYREQALPIHRDKFPLRRDSTLPGWIQHCFDGFAQGPTAVLVKGDFYFTAAPFIDIAKPDKVISEESEVPVIKGYVFEKFKPSDPYIKIGYSRAPGIEIGTRQ